TTMTHALPNLPAPIAREIVGSLYSYLPPPVVDTAEARAARQQTALALITELRPADVVEADLAARIVAASYHADDSLRVAAQPGQPQEEVRRHRAQANSMMRTAERMRHSLERRQSTREKAEAAMHPEAMERAGWWFREASVPATASPAPDVLAEAENYASANPERAARIRATGGLPEPLDFTPPRPDVVATLVNGTSTILCALDHIARRSAESRAMLQRDDCETREAVGAIG
ncbi:MAG TPA: hypothetical protein VGI78_19005, partial [Acetobacteraceae bacterium]